MHQIKDNLPAQLKDCHLVLILEQVVTALISTATLRAITLNVVVKNTVLAVTIEINHLKGECRRHTARITILRMEPSPVLDKHIRGIPIALIYFFAKLVHMAKHPDQHLASLQSEIVALHINPF